MCAGPEVATWNQTGEWRCKCGSAPAHVKVHDRMDWHRSTCPSQQDAGVARLRPGAPGCLARTSRGRRSAREARRRLDRAARSIAGLAVAPRADG